MGPLFNGGGWGKYPGVFLEYGEWGKKTQSPYFLINGPPPQL
ncbi:hypothetical protein EBI_26497 [Enterocytozoon bieneusi H348]|nr:hypothetical protein EBI_26497 [Enterocytozoon bieneusi H348]|eukprot:XP_002650915.1 hypothetical protein EBI_26497 [Enterocytozoon bieneusi H348]